MNCPCELPTSGAIIYRCERLACEMTPHYCDLYHNREHYRVAWDEGRGPGQREAGKARLSSRKPKGGPGRELKNLLRRFGIKDVGCGSCGGFAAKMDRWGTATCRENLGTIVDHLERQAAKRKLRFSRYVTARLVRLAIWLAERKGCF